MKNIIKTLAVTSLLATTYVNAITFEYNSLYKDTRVMGMGGANVALGGESSAVFYNPAGLSGMAPCKDIILEDNTTKCVGGDGLELELVNISAIISGKSVDLVMDSMKLASTAADSIANGQYSDFSPFLTKYTGAPISLGVNDYSSMAYRGKSWAFTVGVLLAANLAVQIHNPLGSAGIIEVNGFTNTGIITGFSMDLLNDNSLHVGLGAKMFFGQFGGYEFNNDISAGISINHLTGLMESSDSVGYLVDNEMLNPYTQLALDAGVIYDLDGIIPFGDWLHPSIATSFLNIGNIQTANGNIIIPQTLNLGVALRPDLYLFSDWLLTDWVFTADYVDVLYAHEDGSFGKRLRMGARMSLFKGWFAEATVSAGLYNANWTAGAQLRLMFLDLMVSTYAEELGASVGQDPDRRYQFSIAMGW